MSQALSLSIPPMIILLVLILACGEQREVTPSELLPFEYQVRLTVESSDCLDSDQSIINQDLRGSLNLGELDGLVIAEMTADHLQWRFSGLICTDDSDRLSIDKPNALCLGLRSSKLLKRIPRVSETPLSAGESLLCEQWTSSPASLPPLASLESSPLFPSDQEWRDRFELCCQTRSSDDFTFRLELEDPKLIEGAIDLTYEMTVRSQNTKGSALSDNERLGALALCGSPRSSTSPQSAHRCTERFTLHAEAK